MPEAASVARVSITLFPPPNTSITVAVVTYLLDDVTQRVGTTIVVAGGIELTYVRIVHIAGYHIK